MCTQRDMALVDRLDSYDRLVEVGIGTRTSVAEMLANTSVTVVGIDIHNRSVPGSVQFACDDVTTPDHDLYTDAGAIYGLRLPPELHRPVWQLAREHDADFLFTTLGGDPPDVPVEPEQLPGTTLYRAREGPGPA